MGTLSSITEDVRQAQTGDNRFWRRMGYVFELKTSRLAPDILDGLLTYPMVLPPTGYTFNESFTVEATETLGGNLVVEESGIIKGRISLEFDFGFAKKLAE